MDTVRGIQKWLSFGLSAEQEDRFREANFGGDIAQARIFVFLIILPFVALLVNDYGFLGLSRTFYALLALRLAFAAYTVLFLKSLKGFTSYRSYDRAVFFWGIFLAFANAVINATRPENFVAHTIVTVLAVFVIVLAIPNRFTNQVILALVYTIGQTLIIVPSLRVSPQASFVVLLSMLMVNAIAITSSWLLHFWRRREFLTREEIEKARVEIEIHNAHLQAIINSLPLGLWIVDATGKMTFINGIASKIWGGMAPSAKDVDEYSTYKAWWDETGGPIAAENMPLARAIRDETLIEKAVDFERFDGTHGTQLVSSAPIKTSDGTIVGGVAIVQDITESKKAEEKLQLLADVVDSSEDSILTLSLKGIITSWNEGAERVYGYSAEEIVGRHFSVLEPADLKGEMKKLIERVKNNEKIRYYETLRLRKDGALVNVSITLSPVFSSSGELVAVSTIARDITERKRTEEVLRKSETRFRALVTATSEVIYRMSPDWRCMNRLCGRGFLSDTENLNPTWLQEYILPEDQPYVTAVINEAIRTKSIFELEHRVRQADGSIGWTFSRAVPLLDKNGEIIEWFGAASDITERKQAEEALAKMDIARQKEIHHRIKNNLQVISSLLDLTAERFNNRECIQDSEVLKAFRESQDRVISMALIHEELYKGEGFETLNFSLYIEELAVNLLQTYMVGNLDINLKMDLEENAFFDMDTAVPLGIIVNELVSNSLKHAFPGRNEGEIRIELHKEENGECTKSINEDCKITNFVLTVSDNGVGIPENFDMESIDTLGMQLVTSLVDQLDGELELKRDNGTEFAVRFTVTEKEYQTSALATQQLIE